MLLPTPSSCDLLWARQLEAVTWGCTYTVDDIWLCEQVQLLYMEEISSHVFCQISCLVLPIFFFLHLWGHILSFIKKVQTVTLVFVQFGATFWVKDIQSFYFKLFQVTGCKRDIDFISSGRMWRRAKLACFLLKIKMPFVKSDSVWSWSSFVPFVVFPCFALSSNIPVLLSREIWNSETLQNQFGLFVVNIFTG